MGEGEGRVFLVRNYMRLTIRPPAALEQETGRGGGVTHSSLRLRLFSSNVTDKNLRHRIPAIFFWGGGGAEGRGDKNIKCPGIKRL